MPSRAVRSIERPSSHFIFEGNAAIPSFLISSSFRQLVSALVGAESPSAESTELSDV